MSTTELASPPPSDAASVVAPSEAVRSSRWAGVRRWLLLVAWTLVLAGWVALPVRLLYPFRVQTPFEVALSYDMRRLAPLFTTLGWIPLAAILAVLLRGQRRRWSLIPIVLCVAAAGGATWFARQNHFEWMFNPLSDAVYAKAADATFVADDEMVIAVSSGLDSAAFPVLQMAYHHLVMDTLGGEPIVATYCTLCHTGLVWGRTVDGQVLTFHLYGINNQNMLMRDHQTGSWWQQANGMAIQGPLKGKRLPAIVHDEIAFAVYKRERPGGRVLRPSTAHQEDYAPANWERLMKRRSRAAAVEAAKTAPPGSWYAREHVVGVLLDSGAAKAYPFPSIRKGGPVNDTLADTPILIVVGDDRRSFRAFERTVDGRALEFIARAGVKPLVLADLQTGSEWDFSGNAVSGPLAGKSLRRVWASKEYWFNWKLQRPHTKKYAIPAPPTS